MTRRPGGVRGRAALREWRPERSGGARLETLLETAERLGGNPLPVALQRSLAIVLPLVMVGALAAMLADLPVPPVRAALDAVFGSHWRTLCASLARGTLGVASLAVLCSLSAVRAEQHNKRHPNHPVNPAVAAGVALSCYIILATPTGPEAWRQIFSLDRGLLLAVVLGLGSSGLLLRLARSRLLQPPLGQIGHNPALRDVLEVLPASMLTIFASGLARTGLAALGVQDLQAGLAQAVASPLAVSADDLPFGLLYTLLSQGLWLVGLHGPNMLFGLEEGILIPAGLANGNAVLAGLPAPFVFTKQFFDAFTRMGGSGCTLCLILAVLLRSRNIGFRRLCLLALLPALCNVNEPLIFGIPLVLNPVFALPFVLVPALQTFTAWAATLLELVPRTIATQMPWTTPALVSGYAATGSAAGAVLQAVNLALGTACYLPFVLLAERLRERRSRRAMEELLQAALQPDLRASVRKCLDLPGETGRLAEMLAQDLARALPTGDQLYMVYQPQVSGASGRVIGVEALLRWRHPAYGDIPPPVIIALAEDAGHIQRLGLLALAMAGEQRAAWTGLVPEGVVMSVNVSPMQLEDLAFASKVRAVLREAGLSPRQLELEITESVSISGDSGAAGMLLDLRESGVRVAIDDFGMGHTSLRYLRHFPVDTVKIDRSLTLRDQGDVNGHIVRSIVELSSRLGIVTLVEGIEREDQLASFLALGCEAFQGYFFSRPLPGEACLEFIRRNAFRP